METNIAFLLAQACDGNGRMVADYFNFTEERWEDCHDHMQWAFPTHTKSAYNPRAATIPLDFELSSLTDDELQRCRATISLLLRSYTQSLGVEFLINHTLVTFTLLPRIQYPAWASSRDHNVLRMTRVLECLGIFGMTNIQTALHDFLVYEIAPTYFETINAKTVAYWVAAKEGKLHLMR